MRIMLTYALILIVRSFNDPGGTASDQMHISQYDPPSLQEAPVAKDIVDRYLLDPRGNVEGLLLRDGSQLHITSRAAEDLVRLIQPGDQIEVHGRRRSDSPVIHPDIIINLTDQTSFMVPATHELPFTENRASLIQMIVMGKIELLLYDDFTGKIEGILLSDGTQVRLPPDASDTFRQSLHLHDEVTVEGNGTRTPYGHALEALAIGPAGKTLTFLSPSTRQLGE